MIDDPNIRLSEVSAIGYMMKHGLSDYAVKISNYVLLATLRKSRGMLGVLESNLALLTDLYTKGKIYEPELMACETLILFLVNSIGMIRAEMGMKPSPIAQKCIGIIDRFQESITTAV